MEALIGGAALGAVAGELLKAVLHGKEKASSFRPMFERLQSTLNSITRRLDEINRLTTDLDIQHQQELYRLNKNLDFQQQRRLHEFEVLVDKSKTLVQKCSKVSRINRPKRKRYQNRLSELEDSLKTYFTTHLQLDLDQFSYYLKKSTSVEKLQINLWGEATAGPSQGLLKGSAYEIDLDPKRFDLVRKGAHVTSYKWKARQRGYVFMKSINLEVPVTENEFQQRMEGIGKVGQHPNIMLPFGSLFSETARYLFYDYAPTSSLYAFLREPNILGTKPHWYRILKIILGAARGISHIHSQGGIIHGNIKSSNVIVTADYDGCISDFGLAPMMNIPALTPELGAPELKETGEATQKSDVYNFGVILSEIVNQHNNVLRHWIVGFTQVQIRQIIFRCKNRDPDRRPKMDEVVRQIQVVLSASSYQTKTMEQKVVVKVSMDGPNSHSKAMEIAAGISGVESVVLQGEDKNQLVVTGEGVDAVELTSLVRNNLGYAELISVSSVEEEEKEGGGEKRPKSREDSQSRMQEARKLSGGETSKTNESGKSFAANLTQDTLGNESTDLFKPRTENMDGRKSMEKYDFGLTEPPNAREWHDAESVKLGGTNLSNLPEEPICPKLGILCLEKNYKLRKIPPAFFTNMPLLRFLDLSETAIMALPKSMFELPVLATLLLKNCKFLMKLPSEVGKLRRLEILDMEGTEIINLPIEIKELSLLIILRVSLYGCLDHDGKSSRQSNEIISSGLISALSNLECIFIYVNPNDERWDACVEGIAKEVCGLTSLRILGFYFPRVELLSCLKPAHASMIYQSRFKLIIGGHSKRIISRLPRNVELELNTRYRCLKYINGEGVPEVIKKVLENATAFHLDRHMTARNLTEFGIENIEYCVLGECKEMQVIFDGNDVDKYPGARWIRFDSLKFLYIYYMKNLKSIWEGPTHNMWLLRGLKSLTVSTCPELTTIFTVGLLENLHKLEELTVRDCPAIKSLVSCEEGAKQSVNYYLPELRTISLHYIPELVSISSEVCIAPKLEELSLYGCPKLKSLSIKEVSSTHLKKIAGAEDWWTKIEQVQRNQFDSIFVPINKGTCF